MHTNKLQVYNTYTRKKEIFTPYHPPYIGMYLCGPTVYGESHLGHARSAISFDVIFRYLQHIGYQVTYVRNITDVGHLERDRDEGDDKIVAQAKREQITPMEVAQRYTNSYHHDMRLLNVAPPSIEPRASGHITEQIELINKVIENGLAYVSNGSVYFDVTTYHKKHHYGLLSGRIIEDLLVGTRPLTRQDEKKNPLDFALWKNAPPSHIMQWPSPWGWGFPGWHTECTALATKYLGNQFEIHGGGMDLLFPHHECELAQAQGVSKAPFAKYWLHNNMVTISGTKMGKSLGNCITLAQLFNGDHAILDQPYTPMALRLFILQGHYRSPLAFSTTALKGAHISYRKLMNGLYKCTALGVQYNTNPQTAAVDPRIIKEVHHYCDGSYQAMDDDFNTPKLLSTLFHLLKIINALQNKQIPYTALDSATYQRLQTTYVTFITTILGLQEESKLSISPLMEMLLPLYNESKANKNYQQVDLIRNNCKKMGILLKDNGKVTTWEYIVNT